MGRKQHGIQQTQAMVVQDSECDDPHKLFRAPMVEVESYSGFLEEIPSLKSDFFKSPIPEFAHLMQELLSDLASNITQTRIKNLHKSIELTGRVLTKNKSRKIRPFCPRQHTEFGTAPTAVQNSQNATSYTANNAQAAQSRQTLRVLRRLDKTNRQQMDQKNSQEGIQHSVQESEFREVKGV
ncbi:hypothetical protein BB561_006697 [Smittium simulii]|uniref:Uncharacterized protein n=1 Tax=Smittium simulii TaxID=133385 RepID=A0A2T9Y2H9_9FUNG|nr:hypothetical protein BB561_006697 [Smittium simulii]